MEDKELVQLDFRIITTYGEVRTVSGQRVSIQQEKKDPVEPVPGKEPWQEILEQIAAQREKDFLQLRSEIGEYTERLHGIGSWLINKQTGQTWYSDNVFRIYDLAPQSLNAHANTFSHFIHKEDRIAVADAFEKAYADKTPLHIEYRIVLADGETKYVQQITKWFYSANGQDILGGIVRDVTEERMVADELLAAQSSTLLHQQILKISEQQCATGYWVINLATRKTSYSENYYRVYGIKQVMLPAFNSFLNLVHADDRQRVRELIDKMFNEHVVPETEFRIVRPDGKPRHIKQSGKIFITQNKDLMMIGLVQDVSVQKGLEKKIQELNESIELNKVVEEMSEHAAEVTSFVWLPDGYMQWSDSFHSFLGYRPGAVETLPRVLYKTIYPADLKVFRDAETLLLNNQNHDDINIRFVSKGAIKQTRISFRRVNFGRDIVVALVHDISRQVQFQHEFTENKLYAQLVTDSVSDLVIFTNCDHIITHWNAVAEDKTGIGREDALQQNLFDVLPRLSEGDFLGQLHLAAKGNEVHASRVHNCYLRKAQDYWLWPLKNEAGEVLGVLHVVQDVSKQLELQQQLSERLNFIENLVELSVDRIVVLDRFMNYLYWNKKAEQHYAINKERVLGKNILEIFPGLRNDPSYQQFRMVLKGETVYLPPVVNEETDEYFETYLIPIKDDTGEVSAILWTVHDLTREWLLQKERRKAEQELLQLKDTVAQTAEDNYHTLFNAIDEGFAVCELVRDEEGNVIDYIYLDLNPAFETHFDLKRSQVVGRRRNEIFSPDSSALKMYADVVASDKFLRREFYSESVKQWYEIGIYPRGGDRFAVLFNNISTRKEWEEQLKTFNTTLEQQVDERTKELLKKTEELQKQLTLLRYTEYLAQSGSWEYEIETGNFTWSEGMYKMFALPSQMKVQPETYLDFVIEEDRPIAKKIVNHFKKKHDPFEDVIRINRNNEVRALKIKASVIYDENRRPRRIVGVDVDVTDVRQAEERLKDTEHWLDQTAKASPDAIMVYNLKKKQPTLLNNCYAEWLGICNKDLIAMGVEERLKLVHSDDRLKLLHFNGRIAEANDGDVLTVEYRVYAEDRKILWIRNRSKVFQRDEHGNVTHMLSVLQNVTEEIALRDELKRRTQFAESILDSSTNRITVFDRNYKFVTWNRRCEEIHGVTRDKVIGRTIFEMFPGVEKHEVFMKAQQQSLKGEYVHVPQVQDGYTGTWLELFYIPLKNEAGETYAVLNIMHDVTKFVRSAEELDALNKQLEAKNTELEQKNEEITSFAFVASHDMKEPLRKIHTFSDWLMEQEQDRLSEKGQGMVEKINNSVHRMELLIEDILVLTKIHSDLYKGENVDLNNILKQVLDDMREKIETTSTIIHAVQLPSIKANSNHVFYLFKNLISNAIKFQKPGSVPELTISSEIVKGSEVKANDAGEFLKLSFADNGFGFDQRYSRKIFQVFQRLHGKHEYEGTGIGLAICRKIMENHNGMINVNSEEGKGSVFNCFFPLH